MSLLFFTMLSGCAMIDSGEPDPSRVEVENKASEVAEVEIILVNLSANREVINQTLTVNPNQTKTINYTLPEKPRDHRLTASTNLSNSTALEEFPTGDEGGFLFWKVEIRNSGEVDVGYYYT